MIKKTRVKNWTNNYGHQDWRPHVDKLIIEMLCHHTPPTCIQSVMVVFSKGKIRDQVVCIKLKSVHFISWRILAMQFYFQVTILSMNYHCCVTFECVALHYSAQPRLWLCIVSAMQDHGSSYTPMKLRATVVEWLDRGFKYLRSGVQGLAKRSCQSRR